MEEEYGFKSVSVSVSVSVSRNEKLEKLRQQRENEKKKKEEDVENALNSLEQLNLYLDKELVIHGDISEKTESKKKIPNKISDLINKFNKL